MSARPLLSSCCKPVNHHYPTLFALTLIPGLLAAALMAFVVQEKERKPVPHISFGESLRALPKNYRRFLVAVGLFGMGDFAHTLLILLATMKLTPTVGAAKAASIATGLYVLHNILYAVFSMVAGWLADRMNKGLLLASGYFMAAGMALMVILLPINVWTLALIFLIGGVYVGIEETLEDSFCAELVPRTSPRHGIRNARHGQRNRRLHLQRYSGSAVDSFRDAGRFRLQRCLIRHRRCAGASGSSTAKGEHGTAFLEVPYGSMNYDIDSDLLDDPTTSCWFFNQPGPGQPLGDVKLGMRLQFPNGQSVLISTKGRIEVDRPIVLLDAWYQEPWNASLHEDFLSSYVALDSPQMSFSPQVRSPYAGVANYVQLVSADNASDYYPYSQNTEGEYVLDNVDPYKGDIPISPDARCSVLFDDAPRFQGKVLDSHRPGL